jgi:hypothetical protein
MCVIYEYIIQFNILFMALLKNLSHYKNIVYCRSVCPEAHLIISKFNLNDCISRLFNNIANILYAVFSRVIGL